MKVAIIHYWLFQMRGGEKVILELCKMFPNAVIFTHVYDPTNLPEEITRHEIRQTFISKLPGAKKYYQKYLPLMPLALEQLDMREFDLIISSESGPAKGIIPNPDAKHICYCHSPMRYIWDHYHTYRERSGRLTRLMMPLLSSKLRMWDVTNSARVDKFVANSNHVSNRIEKYYRRDAEVIFPPVDTDEFSPIEADELEDYYLLAGELVSYKRPDLAIDAFNENGKKLVVIGEGPERKQLEKRAKGNISFIGKVPFEELKSHFAKCKALIFPGEEDFGIIPVEVMASGRPVIAYARGGALDTVLDGITGVYFNEQTQGALNGAILNFESVEDKITVKNCCDQADKFSIENFHTSMNSIVRRTLDETKNI